MATTRKKTAGKKTTRAAAESDTVWLRHKTSGRVFEYTEALARSGETEVISEAEARKALGK